MRKTILTLVALALFSGCATNGQFDGKKTALLVGGILVVGAVAASSSSDSSSNNCGIGLNDNNPIPGATPCR